MEKGLIEARTISSTILSQENERPSLNLNFWGMWSLSREVHVLCEEEAMWKGSFQRQQRSFVDSWAQVSRRLLSSLQLWILQGFISLSIILINLQSSFIFYLTPIWRLLSWMKLQFEFTWTMSQPKSHPKILSKVKESEKWLSFCGDWELVLNPAGRQPKPISWLPGDWSYFKHWLDFVGDNLHKDTWFLAIHFGWSLASLPSFMDAFLDCFITCKIRLDEWTRYSVVNARCMPQTKS